MEEPRRDVKLTNLDQPLLDPALGGPPLTKRDLVEYLEAVADRFVPVLRDRPLSVVRVLRGQAPFMQKNVSKYAPDWLPTATIGVQGSTREVHYPLCNDRDTLRWFANQRAVEYHATLFRWGAWQTPTHLVLDLDPPEHVDDPARAFPLAVAAARLVREVLTSSGMSAAVKTSGAKGVHVFAPLDGTASVEDVAAATRAVAARAERLDPVLTTTAFVREDRHGKVFLDATRAGGATVVAAYSPRVRPGAPVSFPLPWEALDTVRPSDFTITTAITALADTDPWQSLMPPAQTLDASLVEEGRTIPVARVAAMHAGKRRARLQREAAEQSAGATSGDTAGDTAGEGS